MSKNRRVSKFNGVEMAVISPFAESIDFDHNIVRECVDRGFLPADLMEPLLVAQFLSRTILAAQLAQRTYGVPASFLIGMALYESGWNIEGLTEGSDSDDAESMPACSPSVQQWFLEAAKVLAESPTYAEALPLAGCDVKAYGRKLATLGFRALDVADFLTPIENYGLEDCDLPALRQPNEYTREHFKESRDERGSRQLHAAWLDLVPLVRRDALVPDPETAARSLGV